MILHIIRYHGEITNVSDTGTWGRLSTFLFTSWFSWKRITTYKEDTYGRICDFVNPLWQIMFAVEHGYITLVVTTIPSSFPRLCHYRMLNIIICYISTWGVSYVKQEPQNLPERSCLGVPVQSLVLFLSFRHFYFWSWCFPSLITSLGIFFSVFIFFSTDAKQTKLNN